jgi:hypothetical protein
MEYINTWLQSNIKSNDEKLLNYTAEAYINKNNLACDLFAHIKAFRAKLILLESQVKNCNFVHMPYRAELHKKGEAEFPSSCANLVI